MEQLIALGDIFTGVEAADKERKRKHLEAQEEHAVKRLKLGGTEDTACGLQEAEQPQPRRRRKKKGGLLNAGEALQAPATIKKRRKKKAEANSAEDDDVDGDDVEPEERDFEQDGSDQVDEEEDVEDSEDARRRQAKPLKSRQKNVSGTDLKGKPADEEWDWKKAKIHPDILKALKEAGIVQPTPIQRATLKPAMEGRCILAAAQTGSGKTLAFGVPVLHRLLKDLQESGDDRKRRLLSCLVLTPTRELAMQIKEHLCLAAKYTKIMIQPLVGGMSEQKQERVLDKLRPHVLVATPGRLGKLLSDNSIPFLHQSLSLQLKYLVVDEGDRMLEMHHFGDMDGILKQLAEAPADKSWGQIDTMKGILKEGDRTYEGKNASQVRTFTSCFEEYDGIDAFVQSSKDAKKTQIRYLLPKLDGEGEEVARKQGSKKKGKVKKLARRQVFIMSATMTLDTKWKDGTKKIRKWNPVDTEEAYMSALVSRVGLPLKAFMVVDVNPEHHTADNLKEMTIECTEKDRDYYLYYFLTMYPGRTIIFVNAISAVRRLASILRVLRLPCYPMHAKMEQRQRLRNFDLFKSNDRAIIVATDVVGRGTDVQEVKYVVHYQFPRNTEIYMHRCGRTARAFRAGLALTLLTPRDVSQYKQVCYSLGYKKGLESFPVDTCTFTDIKPRIKMALEIDRLINEKSKKEFQLDWYKKAARDMDMDLDEELVEEYRVDPHDRKIRDLKVKAMERELKQLLSQPISSIKGAYLASAANVVRRELHTAALAHRVEFDHEKPAATATPGK